MNLYEVIRDGTSAGLAYETAEGQIFVYVPNTGRFHRSDAQTEDFYVHQESTYRPVRREAAVDLMRAETGRIDARSRPHLLRRFQDDPDALDPAFIIGDSAAPALSARQIAAARARALAEAEPGEWLVWKVYPREKKQLAQVSANDIRSGKIVALNKLGKVDAYVLDAGAEIRVLVSRVGVTEGPVTLQSLSEAGRITAATEELLAAAVASAKSVLITGGAGSAKTTLLRALLNLRLATSSEVIVGDTTDLVTVETEWSLIRLPAGPSAAADMPALHEQLELAMRMVRDYVFVDEIRSGDDAYTAAMTAREQVPIVATLFAHGVDDARARLADLISLSHPGLAIEAGHLFDVVVHAERHRGRADWTVTIAETAA